MAGHNGDPVTVGVLEQAFKDHKTFMEYQFKEVNEKLALIVKNDKEQDRRIQKNEHRVDTQEQRCTEIQKKEDKKSDDSAKWAIIIVGWGLTLTALFISVLKLKGG